MHITKKFMIDLLLKNGLIEGHALERYRAMTKIEVSLMVIEAGLIPKECFVGDQRSISDPKKRRLSEAVEAPEKQSVTVGLKDLPKYLALSVEGHQLKYEKELRLNEEKSSREPDVVKVDEQPAVMSEAKGAERSSSATISEVIRNQLESDRKREIELHRQKVLRDCLHEIRSSNARSFGSDTSEDSNEPPAKRPVGRPRKYSNDVERVEKSMAKSVQRVADYMIEMNPYHGEISISEDIIRATHNLIEAYQTYLEDHPIDPIGQHNAMLI